MLADVALGAGIAFCIATFTTPVGVSGAVFLVPVQISLLRTPSPSVTPTYLGVRLQTQLGEPFYGRPWIGPSVGVRYVLLFVS